jgi:hypothetical protein
MNEYYPLRNVKEVVIKEQPKTDYFIGTEEIVIPLQARALDAAGKELDIPEQLLYFTGNGEKISTAGFRIEAEGTYYIVAHLGEIRSDTLTIRALDPSKLSLHLSVNADQQVAFIADGKSALDFEVSLFHHGVAVPLSSEFVLYCNKEILNSQSFSTKKAGQYKFKATGAGLTSNEISIEALSPVKKLRLSKQSTDPHFFGYNLSETGFVLEGFDAANQPVALSEDIKLFKGTSEIDPGSRFKSNELGKVNFQARGYKVESNKLDIEVLSPVKTLKLEYRQHGSTFWADGFSEISFSVKAFDFNGKEIVPTADVKLYLGAEVIDFGKRFTTKRSGNLVFKAKGFNSESGEITVTAAEPTNFNIVRIPVIFHEVNTTALTQAKIIEILDGVTKAFRNQWNYTGGPKDGNACDLFIEVYPADRDPSGNILPIKGLDRVRSDKQSFKVDNSKRINEAEEDAGNYFWNPEQYYNIWVYPNILGDFASASWAYYPTLTQPLDGMGTAPRGTEPRFPYGAFLNAKHIGPGTGVSVTAHEMGHSLALFHVFDGNLYDHNGCRNGDTDYCADTKPYDRKAYESNYQAEGYNRKSCDDQTFVATNLMDYYIGHENSFTIDQRKRARHTINYGLWLPTAANGFQNGRVMREGYIKKPEKYIYRTPVACYIPLKGNGN